jgi:hypothetical protein
MATYGKSYSTKEEFEFRMETYFSNLAMSQAVAGESATHTVGDTHLTDLT